LLYVTSLALSQETCDEIIAKHLEITGTANIDKELKQFTIEGAFLQNKMNLPIKIQAKMPDKYRMDMVFNKLSFVKISNGNKNWEYNPMSDTIVTKYESEPVAKDFIQRWTGGLYLHTHKKIVASLIGTEIIEDIEAYKLKIEFKENTRIYFIDKLSYLILRIDDDTEEKKITYYRDYRKIGKYFVPFNMAGYENGVPAISMQFNDVKLNPAISDSVFSKPKAG